jgi:hypothetical protein
MLPNLQPTGTNRTLLTPLKRAMNWPSTYLSSVLDLFRWIRRLARDSMGYVDPHLHGAVRRSASCICILWETPHPTTPHPKVPKTKSQGQSLEDKSPKTTTPYSTDTVALVLPR